MWWFKKKSKKTYPNFMGKTVVVNHVEGREGLNGKVAKIVGTYGYGIYDAQFEGVGCTMGVFARDLQLMEEEL